MSLVHVLLPNDIDDPTSPSGGNVYDRRICRGLANAGWSVREHAVPGRWPYPEPRDRATLAHELHGLPDHALVLVDGLIASAVPEVLRPHRERVALVVLVHAALGDPAPDRRAGELAALSSAVTLLTTSHWSARRLVELYPSLSGRIHVAPPGVDPAPRASGSPDGSRLLCVAAVSRHKGHDVLADALARISDLSWECACVGPLDRDPGFVRRLRLPDGRVSLVGPRVGADLAARYAAADLLLLPSRGETYGMVVTEALARAIPVVGSAVGGVAEALGETPHGRPGLLVPPEDPVALAGALRRWLSEPDLRDRLRAASNHRRGTLSDWSVTSTLVAEVLASAAGVGAR
jgi:glycosyltransferase involved in cell wall biosynthesis